MIDNKARALIKAISWRVIASLVLGFLTWLITGSLAIVGALVVLHNMVQVFVYFLHERVWNSISWGKTKGLFIQMTGMSGAGKTTISRQAAKILRSRGYRVELIDGDEYRQNITKDLGFSKEDRIENIRRLGFIGRILARNNVISIMSTINPYKSARQELTRQNAKTVYIKCSLSELKKRDPKGLYQRALLPKDDPNYLDNFTGISDPYQAPSDPDLILDTEYESVDSCVTRLVSFVEKNI